MRPVYLVILNIALLASVAPRAQALPIMNFTYHDTAVIISGQLYIEQIGDEYFATDAIGTVRYTDGSGPYPIVALAALGSNRIVSFTGPGYLEYSGISFRISGIPGRRVLIWIRYLDFGEPDYVSTSTSGAPIADGSLGVFTLTDVPEPRTAALIPAGIAALAGGVWRRRRRARR